MEQLEIFPLQSPCVGVCELNNKGYCKGCLRSREERFNWLAMTPAQQQEVMRLCRNRKARVEAARRKARVEAARRKAQAAEAQAAEAADPPPPPGWDF
ncbi:MAG: hypothetical protein BGO64_13820 [Aeromonas sp. 62-46]|uniref:DUF1289 domain-containing protein n=1 Tax=Aeromonas sp. 62-46 TaxID=1895698 RepID=UPI000925BFF0|nr:DUF1289 domain-containing protein [Aeromonas sp. 62-46]OJW65389.1 MAG: hypothetical protein BGO64_13820 [Aeromonas sp. 62-46]